MARGQENKGKEGASTPEGRTRVKQSASTSEGKERASEKEAVEKSLQTEETALEKEAEEKPLQTKEETGLEKEAVEKPLQISLQREETPWELKEAEKEEFWETEEDTDEDEEAGRCNDGPAVDLGNGGLILVLFETPSGFAIFSYDGVKLLLPNALKDIWADFANDYVAKSVIWLEDFQIFEDKVSAINQGTGVSEALATMIQKYIVPGQKLAVGNEDYQKIIENDLDISCMFNPAVEELMWGLKIQMRYLVPAETSEWTNEDRFPMSEGMKFLLNHHGFKVKRDMMVTKRIIEMAGLVYECNLCVNKHSNSLRSVAEHIFKISRIDTRKWDLMKLATALKMICFPEEEIGAARWLFSKQQLKRLRDDAPKYEDKILKMPCMVVYDEMYYARKVRSKAGRVLSRLVKWAKKAYEAEQACEAPSDHGISPHGKKIHPGINPVIIDELTEFDTMVSAQRKKRQVPPNLAPSDALERYTHISSHPLHRTDKPGILSMDIHPSKDIVATGGIDTNAVLFDRLSGQILCTLTGHSEKITSLKFVHRNELFVTGSADKTVRIWQGSEDGNYSCIHTLKEHTAEISV